MEQKTKWYAVLVMSNKEFYVRDKLELTSNETIRQYVKDILLPTYKKVSEIRRKKIVKNVPVYPSYIFINAAQIEKVASCFSEISYIVKVVGYGEKMTPIGEEEMNIVRAMSGIEKIQSAFKFKVSDMVEVIGGHCKGLSGRIVDILDIDKLRIEIQIFNRAIYANIKVEDIKLA